MLKELDFPRKGSIPCKAGQAVIFPKPGARVAHVLPASDLVLPTEPLSQPPRRVIVNGRVGRADLSVVVVVRPPGYHPVQALYHVLGSHRSVPCGRLLTDLTADALDARLARAGPYIGPSIRPMRCPRKSIGSSGHRRHRVFCSLTGSFSLSMSRLTATSISAAGALPTTQKSSA